jgi:hypothetical protein
VGARAEVREVIPPLVKLLRDLFSNPVTAKDFFFVNDLKVLVEIIMREITDTSDTKVRPVRPSTIPPPLVCF